MACRYFLGDKELIGEELKAYMKSTDVSHVREYLPEVNKDVYSALSWTPGEAQAARYDLSKQIERIKYFPPDDKYPSGNLQAWDKNGNQVIDKGAMPNDLPDIIGKEIADKILKTKLETNFSPRGYHNLENADLKIGGEGMKAFYDKMLVNTANKLVSKMGGKVEYENLGKKLTREIDHATKEYIIKADGEEIGRFKDRGKAQELYNEYHNKYGGGLNSNSNNIKIPLIRITPQMRDKIKSEGFPLFTAPQFVPVTQQSDFEPKLTAVTHNPFLMTPISGNPFND